MKFLRILLIVVGVLALIVLVPPLFMTSTYTVTRATTIKAPAEKIFKLVTDTKEWEKWQPWKPQDPKATYTYSDQTAGTGAWMAWKGEVVGEGKLTFTEQVASVRAMYELKMADFPASQGGMELKETPAGTEVVWTDRGVLAYPMGRWFGALSGGLDNMIGPDFEKGLASIKQLAEAEAMPMASDSANTQGTLSN